MPVHHILFPTEFSDRDRLAEPWVRRFAEATGARLTILHVIPKEKAYRYHDRRFDETEDAKRLHESVNRQLAEVIPGLAAGRVTAFGDVGKAIADCAAESNADMIMLPLDEYTAFLRLICESVTARIIRDKRWRVWSASHAALLPELDHLAL